MLFKTCGGCGLPIKHPARYCQQCKDRHYDDRATGKRLSNRKYNQSRDKGLKQFYNSADWKRLSQTYMQDKVYRCERCNGIATEVHHIKPLSTVDGWNERLVYMNLMSVCVKCHNIEHGRFKPRRET